MRREAVPQRVARQRLLDTAQAGRQRQPGRVALRAHDRWGLDNQVSEEMLPVDLPGTFLQMSSDKLEGSLRMNALRRRPLRGASERDASTTAAGAMLDSTPLQRPDPGQRDSAPGARNPSPPNTHRSPCGIHFRSLFGKGK